MTVYNVCSSNLLAAMRDRASTNSFSVRTMVVVYPSVFDVGSFSHTLDNVGKHFYTPIRREFGIAWISLFSRSHETRMLWREQTEKSMASYSPTWC